MITRSASRNSLADVRERLEAMFSDVADPVDLARELFDVVAVLDRSPSLRRALADPSTAGDRKRGMVEVLFTDRVASPTLQLLRDVVQAQWSRPADLADALEVLAVTSIAAGAERDRSLDDLEDELFRFGRIVEGQPRLRASLADPAAPDESKAGLVHDLLSDRATPATQQLVIQAATHPRSRGFGRTLEHYSQLAAERRRRLIAVVRTAVALTEQQRRRLVDALSSAYGHDIHLNVLVDPDVLGGLSVRVGHELIDGTVAGRLDTVRRRLGAAS